MNHEALAELIMELLQEYFYSSATLNEFTVDLGTPAANGSLLFVESPNGVVLEVHVLDPEL